MDERILHKEAQQLEELQTARVTEKKKYYPALNDELMTVKDIFCIY